MRPAAPWRLEPTLRLLTLLPLAIAVAGLVIEVGARGLGPPGDSSQAHRPAWLIAAGTGIMHAVTIGLMLPFVRAHGLTWREAFGFGADRGGRHLAMAAAWTLPALAAAWVLHQASGWVLDRWHIAHDNQTAVEAVRSASQPWELAVLFLFACVTAPAAEELLFRGVLWPLARHQGWRIRGAVAVSVLFALIHFNAAALLPLTALGLFWIWLYERTGNLAAPMLSHALFNAANFVWIALLPS